MFNYFPDVDKFFKRLYYINQEWFKARTHISEAQMKEITEISRRIDDDLVRIKTILKGGANENK